MKGYALIISILLLFTCRTIDALPVMDIALVDPEGDTFLTNNTTPANISIIKNVSGYPEIDIKRIGSTLKSQVVTLFIHLYGSVSGRAKYYFLVRTTGAGGIWGLYDFVIEFTNSSTKGYFATSSKYQDLKDAKSFDLNASSARKPNELYAYIPIELLRDPPSFQISAVSILPKNESTLYADWTKNAKNEEGETPEDYFTLLLIGTGCIAVIFLYVGLSRKEKEKKDTIQCEWCGRRYTRGLLYCPTCGKEPEKKKRKE